MGKKVRDVMTPAPVSVSGQTPLTRAADLMREHGIGDVLVVEKDRLCGMVTDRDIVVRAVADGRDPSQATVGEICSSELVTVSPGDDADAAVQAMRERAIRRLPVVEEDRPVGVLSIGDLAIEQDKRSALADISAKPPSQ